MIYPYAHALLSFLVIVALFWVSMLFNNYIDHRREMYDGETAVWVILGTTYTNVGATALVLIWWHELHQIGQPWRGAVAVGALIFACYIASGIPMAVGDAVRSLNLRSEKH